MQRMSSAIVYNLPVMLEDLASERRYDGSVYVWREQQGNAPFNPVLSGSTKAFMIFPSRTQRA